MSTDHARRVVQRKQKPEKMARRRRCSRCVQHVKVLDLRDSVTVVHSMPPCLAASTQVQGGASVQNRLMRRWLGMDRWLTSSSYQADDTRS